jgi:hypothetical protein
MGLPLQRPVSIVVNLSDKSLNSESPLIWSAIRGFLFSAGSFIINEHLLKRFRVEERHGSDLLEFDFAPPHAIGGQRRSDLPNRPNRAHITIQYPSHLGMSI